MILFKSNTFRVDSQCILYSHTLILKYGTCPEDVKTCSLVPDFYWVGVVVAYGSLKAPFWTLVSILLKLKAGWEVSPCRGEGAACHKPAQVHWNGDH